VHVRGIVITCDIPIQSERVNTILAEILWSRGSYRLPRYLGYFIKSSDKHHGRHSKNAF